MAGRAGRAVFRFIPIKSWNSDADWERDRPGVMLRCYELFLARCQTCFNKKIFWERDLKEHESHELKRNMTPHEQKIKIKSVQNPVKRKHVECSVSTSITIETEMK